jgi:hypothetical protein
VTAVLLAYQVWNTFWTAYKIGPKSWASSLSVANQQEQPVVAIFNYGPILIFFNFLIFNFGKSKEWTRPFGKMGVEHSLFF